MAPNVVSLSRLVSGPLIATLILQESWPLATIGLIVSGASDWLDGYLAKRLNLKSAMGPFLDPLADKVLICSTAGALVVQGVLPYWAAAPILARDICLVTGTYIHYTISGSKRPMSFYQHLMHMKQKGSGDYQVQPFLLSKANTALQLVLIATCMGHGWIQWPRSEHIDFLAKATVASTLSSWGFYTWRYFRGQSCIT